MIIPTPEYDPMFADDGVPFRDKMIDYIKREFDVSAISCDELFPNRQRTHSVVQGDAFSLTQNSQQRKAA